MDPLDHLCVVCGQPTAAVTIRLASHPARNQWIGYSSRGVAYACERHEWEARRLLSRASERPKHERSIGTWTR